MTARRLTTALLAAAAAAGLLVAGAAPSSAASGQSTQYPITFTATGPSLTATLTNAGSGAQLTDYASSAYGDRVRARPGSGEKVTVGTAQCATTTYEDSAVILYGATNDWFNTLGSTRVGASLKVACTTPDGVRHRYTWGAADKCLEMTRNSSGVITVATPADRACDAQDQVVDSRGKQLSSTPRTLPFTATIEVHGTGRTTG